MSNIQDTARISHANFVLKSIIKCTDFMVEYFEGNEREVHLNSLKNVMKDFCELENTYTASSGTLNEVYSVTRKQKNYKKKLDKNRNKDNDEEEEEEEDLGEKSTEPFNVRELFNAKFMEKMSKAAPPAKWQRYVDFEKKLDSLIGQGEIDDDLAVTAAEVNTVDMITMQTMVDPVRVKQCGHSFERSSILSLLKKKPYIRCPMPGCEEVQIKASDLQENLELKRILEQKSTS